MSEVDEKQFAVLLFVFFVATIGIAVFSSMPVGVSALFVGLGVSAAFIGVLGGEVIT